MARNLPTVQAPPVSAMASASLGAGTQPMPQPQAAPQPARRRQPVAAAPNPLSLEEKAAVLGAIGKRLGISGTDEDSTSSPNADMMDTFKDVGSQYVKRQMTPLKSMGEKLRNSFGGPTPVKNVGESLGPEWMQKHQAQMDLVNNGQGKGPMNLNY